MPDQKLEPDELYRVKIKDNGHKITLRGSVVTADPDTYQVLKQDAVDHNGNPLPPEYNDGTTNSSASASGQKVTDTPKES